MLQEWAHELSMKEGFLAHSPRSAQWEHCSLVSPPRVGDAELTVSAGSTSADHIGEFALRHTKKKDQVKVNVCDTSKPN